MSYLLPPSSGAIYKNAAGRVYTGTAGVPTYFEAADVAGALAIGWQPSSVDRAVLGALTSPAPSTQDATGNSYLSGIPGAGSNYLGAVATRCSFPGTSTTANQQTMCRVKHVAMDNLTQVQFVYTNTLLNSGAEAAPGWATTITASIEYPVGTVTKLTFAGANSGVIPNGGILVSDPVTLPSPLYRGVPFYSRTWSSSATGIVFSGGRGLNNVAGSVPNSGEWFAYGATTADLTGVATNVNNLLAGAIFGPVAIIGQTARPSVMIAGDSRVFGFAEAGYVFPIQGTYGGVGDAERALCKRFATLNVGLQAETAAGVAGTAFNVRGQLAKYFSAAVCGYGINDCNAGTAFATTITNLQTFASKYFSGKPFYQLTLPPYAPTSTDGWLTTTGQTANATSNAQRVPLNDAIRAGLGGNISGYLELADVCESGRNTGVWRLPFRTATDLSITTGTNTLTSTAQMQFSTADVNTVITVAGAGAAAAPLTSWVSGYISPTQVALATNASTTVAAATGGFIATYDGLHESAAMNRFIETSTVYDPVLSLAR